MRVRLASTADLPSINDIYNHYVLTSTCTWARDPVTAQERADWLADHGERHPVTVAELDGEVVGWGSLSPFRDRWGYRHTVENSVYVRADRHRRGIGRALLADLIDRARALEYHAVIAGTSAEQAGSVALHTDLGFVEIGRFREVGNKFDRWLDLRFLQLLL